ARSASASILSRRIVPASASRWTNTTAGCSSTACRDCPSRRPKRACRRWHTCASTAHMKFARARWRSTSGRWRARKCRLRAWTRKREASTARQQQRHRKHSCRRPTLIHTRSGNAKWLVEISHANPTWINTLDAERLGVRTGELVRVTTEIGYFVDKLWVTEGIRPGVIACSHHLGRWRLAEGEGTNKISSALVNLTEDTGHWTLRQLHGIRPYKSEDPDTSRVWWQDAGVHQ